MKILRFASILACLAIAAVPAFAGPRVAAKIAPADEYFGHQKISPLGIDNMIRDTEMRENFNPALASRLYGSLATAEDALQDWARKYPQDGWIPKRAYLLSHLFWRMHSPEGDAAAERCRSVLFHYFSKNRFAALAHRESATTYAPVAAAPTPAPAPAAK